MALALERFRPVHLDGGVAAVVPHKGPNVAIPVEEAGIRLRAAYFEVTGRVAPGGACSEVVATLEGLGAADRCTAYLRAAPDGEGIVLDIGDESGAAISIQPGSWSVLDRSPVLMFRTAAMAPLPLPSREGGGLEALRELANLTQADFDLIVGHIVACWLLPDSPVAVLVLTGPPGVAKSTTSDLVMGLVDPTTAARRGLSKEVDWAVTTAATYVVPVDNLSIVKADLSDWISAATTGSGQLLRRLYTTAQIQVVRFKRCFVINGISLDSAIARADLADRVALVRPSRLHADDRLTDAEVRQRFENLRPAAFGELLDIAAAALGALPSIELLDKPRMYDYARVLAAVDQVRKSSALDTYLRGRGDLDRALLSDGTLGGALLAWLETQTTPVEITPTSLLSELRAQLGPEAKLPSVVALKRKIEEMTDVLDRAGYEFTHARVRRGSVYRFTRRGARGGVAVPHVEGLGARKEPAPGSFLPPSAIGPGTATAATSPPPTTSHAGNSRLGSPDPVLANWERARAKRELGGSHEPPADSAGPNRHDRHELPLTDNPDARPPRPPGGHVEED